MTYIYSVVRIQQPVPQVFDYVTTPANWPKWRPSSLEVSGATDHPLQVQEQVTEEYMIAGRRGQIVWTVQECVPGKRWILEGLVAGSQNEGVIVYRFSPTQDGTLFESEFTYTLAGPLLLFLDRLVLHYQFQTESDESHRRL